MEGSLKRKNIEGGSTYLSKKVKIAEVDIEKKDKENPKKEVRESKPAVAANSGKVKVLKIEECFSSNKERKHYPKRFTISHVPRCALSPVSCEFSKSTEKVKFNQSLRPIKEINECFEASISKLNKTHTFKARPAPNFGSPLRPMKSTKKLTIPIEPVFHTEIRAHIRQTSLERHK